MAEEKISAALNEELEVVEKECMRPMQVSGCMTILLSLVTSSLRVLRGRRFYVAPGVVRTATVHRSHCRGAFRPA